MKRHKHNKFQKPRQREVDGIGALMEALKQSQGSDGSAETPAAQMLSSAVRAAVPGNVRAWSDAEGPDPLVQRALTDPDPRPAHLQLVHDADTGPQPQAEPPILVEPQSAEDVAAGGPVEDDLAGETACQAEEDSRDTAHLNEATEQAEATAPANSRGWLGGLSSQLSAAEGNVSCARERVAAAIVELSAQTEARTVQEIASGTLEVANIPGDAGAIADTSASPGPAISAPSATAAGATEDMGVMAAARGSDAGLAAPDPMTGVAAAAAAGAVAAHSVPLSPGVRGIDLKNIEAKLQEAMARAETVDAKALGDSLKGFTPRAHVMSDLPEGAVSFCQGMLAAVVAGAVTAVLASVVL